MAAAASGHDTGFVLWEMPLAQALQFSAAWLETQGNRTRGLASQSVDSATFSRIANR